MSLRALTIALAAAALAPGVLARPFIASGAHPGQRIVPAKVGPKSSFNNPPPSAIHARDESEVMTPPVAEPVVPGFPGKRDLTTSTESEYEDEMVVSSSDIMMRPPAKAPPSQPHPVERGEALAESEVMIQPPANASPVKPKHSNPKRSNPRPDKRSSTIGEAEEGLFNDGELPLSLTDSSLEPGLPSKRNLPPTPPIGHLPGSLIEEDSINVGELPLSPTDPSLDPDLPSKRGLPPSPLIGHLPDTIFEDEETDFDGKTMMLPPADHVGPGTNH